MPWHTVKFINIENKDNFLQASKQKNDMFRHTKWVKTQNFFWLLNSSGESAKGTELHRILKGEDLVLMCLWSCSPLHVLLLRTLSPLQRGLSALADSWELEIGNVKFRGEKNSDLSLCPYICCTLAPGLHYSPASLPYLLQASRSWGHPNIATAPKSSHLPTDTPVLFV